MARNPELDLKPNYSSSSDDEEEQEQEDEQTSDSESDSEFKPQAASKPQPLVPSSSSSSETEAESGSDSDSDSPPKSSAVASKPIEEEVANVESKSAKKSMPPPPAKAKRPAPSPAADEKEKDAKKAKRSDDDSKKQPLFQRVWSEEDEIILLKGMIDCKTKDMGVAYESIKNSLHLQVSRAQLVDKLGRLKKKYVNNAKKEKNGKDRTFSNTHEKEGYELSKIIWGSDTEESKKTQTQTAAKGAASTSLQKNGVGEKEGLAMEVEKNMEVSRFVEYGGMSQSPVIEEEIVKAGWELVGVAKREELTEKWNKFKLQELQLYVQRLHLIKERAEVVLEAMLNSSRN